MKSFEEFRGEQEEYLMERRGMRRPPRNRGGGRRGPNVGDVVGGVVDAATAPLKWGGALIKGVGRKALDVVKGEAGNLLKGKHGSIGHSKDQDLQGLPKNS